MDIEMSKETKYYEKEQADKEFWKVLIVVFFVGFIFGYVVGLITSVLIRFIG